MIRIVALNEECNEEPEGQIVVTKEAQVRFFLFVYYFKLYMVIIVKQPLLLQEAIAEAEYLKAINLKWNGDVKSALSLLNQLLETQVLNEVCITFIFYILVTI